MSDYRCNFCGEQKPGMYLSLSDNVTICEDCLGEAIDIKKKKEAAKKELSLIDKIVEIQKRIHAHFGVKSLLIYDGDLNIYEIVLCDIELAESRRLIRWLIDLSEDGYDLLFEDVLVIGMRLHMMESMEVLPQSAFTYDEVSDVQTKDNVES